MQGRDGGHHGRHATGRKQFMATDGKIQETIERLKALDLDGDSNEKISAICSVFYKPNCGWTLGECKRLRGVLVGMLEQLDPDEWSDSYLAEVGLVRLPKDANGEYIHIGDTIRLNDTTPRVFSLALYDDGWRVGFVGEHGHCSCLPKDVAHYHKPTVEELLFEFGKICQDGYDIGNSIHEYAEKIREVIVDDQRGN